MITLPLFHGWKEQTLCLQLVHRASKFTCGTLISLHQFRLWWASILKESAHWVGTLRILQSSALGLLTHSSITTMQELDRDRVSFAHSKLIDKRFVVWSGVQMGLNSLVAVMIICYAFGIWIAGSGILLRINLRSSMVLNSVWQITKPQSKLYLGALGKRICLPLEEDQEISVSSSGTLRLACW